MNPASPSPLASADDPADSTAHGSTDADGEPDQPPEPASDRAAAPLGRATPAIEWLDRSGGGRTIDHAWIRERLAEAAAQLPDAFARIDVTVVDDRRMASLHHAHCADDATTDVLTFVEAAPPAPIEVDIAVCADEAARHADRGPLGVERELLLYGLHGLLHASGYDDHDPAGYAAMHAREDEILEAIGVGAVFKGDRSGHADDVRTASRDRGEPRR